MQFKRLKANTLHTLGGWVEVQRDWWSHWFLDCRLFFNFVRVPLLTRFLKTFLWMCWVHIQPWGRGRNEYFIGHMHLTTPHWIPNLPQLPSQAEWIVGLDLPVMVIKEKPHSFSISFFPVFQTLTFQALITAIFTVKSTLINQRTIGINGKSPAQDFGGEFLVVVVTVARTPSS